MLAIAAAGPQTMIRTTALVAALAIAGFAVREGREAWRGDPCC